MSHQITYFAIVSANIVCGVALTGVAAVMAALSKRQSAWARLARELSPELPAETTRVEPMSKVAELANAPSSIGRPIRV
jgi:hypothetical protein